MDILRERDVEFDVIEYLEAPLTRADLERILESLPDPPAALVRKDKKFRELGLSATDYEDVADVTELLLEHPELMERPIAISGKRALIARPPEKVNELIG